MSNTSSSRRGAKGMNPSNNPLRSQFARFLDWHDAHADVEAAVIDSCEHSAAATDPEVAKP
jgi:hypothetical protein